MKLFMTNSDEVFPGLRDTDISDVNVIECYDRNDGEWNAHWGKHHSLEAKEIISEKLKEWHKHNDNPFLNKTHTEETRKKMRDNHARPMLGKKMSEETKRKCSIANKGKVRTEETKKRMSESKKGLPSYDRTDEHKKKMSNRIKLWHKERKLKGLKSHIVGHDSNGRFIKRS